MNPDHDLKLLADGRPVVKDPLATDFDSRVEPDWQQRLTISVGNSNADLVGTDHKLIQAAIDYLAGHGGGTARILPGTYRLRNSVFLRRGVRILGSGEQSVLIKEPSTKSELAADSDWYGQEITLTCPDGFEVGDGVCLRGKRPGHDFEDVIRRTLVARSGNRFKLDRGLRQNMWIKSKATVATLFALLDGHEVSNVTIENLTLDGNATENDPLDGNYAGCIFLQDCAGIVIRNVTARNNNGDGISWQIAHDVVVEDCHIHDNADLGLHPGSGSQRPLMRRNLIERNSTGLFFCWGVKYGLAEHNKIIDSVKIGVSIGHRDTDNLIRNNEIIGSGEVGILFREDGARAKDNTADHNHVVDNVLMNNGTNEPLGIDVRGQTDGTVLAGNQIRDTRDAKRAIGIRIGENVGNVTIEGNHFEGIETPQCRPDRQER